MDRNLPHLPHDLIINILSRLPAKPLCRFKSVSKPWLALITDTQFINSHIDQNNKTQKLIQHCHSSCYISILDFQAPRPFITRYSLPYTPSIQLLGSINGILLVRTGRTLRLWNPSIKTFKKFSPPSFSGGFTLYGLGYDSASDDFKVVMAVRPKWKTVPSAVYVFSPRLGSWNRVGEFGYQIIRGRMSDGTVFGGTVLNGAPHSVVERLGPGMGAAVIVCFDFTKEKFKEVPSPDCEGVTVLVDLSVVELGVLGGSLCVVKEHRESHADVWVMKEYGVKESWIKLFVVQNNSGGLYTHRCMPVCYGNGGEVVMLLDSKTLVSYDPEENSCKTILIAEVKYKFDVALYVESVASPHGGNGMKGHR